jgi:hypothetical protein
MYWLVGDWLGAALMQINKIKTSNQGPPLRVNVIVESILGKKTE